MNAALALFTVLAAGDDEPAALARVLRAVREKAGRSVVAIEVSRDSDPDGAGGPGSPPRTRTTTAAPRARRRA